MKHKLKNGIIINIPETHLGVSPWVVKSDKVGFSLTWSGFRNKFDVSVHSVRISCDQFETFNKLLEEMQAACIEANEIYQNILNQSK